MKKLLVIISTIFSFNSYASGGFTWLGGLSHTLHIPQHTITFLIAAVLLTIIGIVYRLKTPTIDSAVIPDNKFTFRNAFEFFGEFIYGITKNILGEKLTKQYYTMILIIFLTIFFSNLIGLVPGFLPPTDNFNTTLALGLFVFIYYNWQGIKVQGIVGHIKHLMGPVWYLAPLMFVIEIISHGVRPISLGLRLKGNMEGDHLVLSIFSSLVPYLVPLPFYIIGIFVCFMQAFVFTLLTIVYISLATETHDHGDHAH